MKEANRSLQVTMDFCDSQRKKTTVVGKMWHMWQRPARITEEQVHAELCYAECGLMKAMLMFMVSSSVLLRSSTCTYQISLTKQSDDSLVSFVRAGEYNRIAYVSRRTPSLFMFRYGEVPGEPCGL